MAWQFNSVNNKKNWQLTPRLDGDNTAGVGDNDSPLDSTVTTLMTTHPSTPQWQHNSPLDSTVTTLPGSMMATHPSTHSFFLIFFTHLKKKIDDNTNDNSPLDSTVTTLPGSVITVLRNHGRPRHSRMSNTFDPIAFDTAMSPNPTIMENNNFLQKITFNNEKTLQ